MAGWLTQQGCYFWCFSPYRRTADDVLSGTCLEGPFYEKTLNWATSPDAKTGVQDQNLHRAVVALQIPNAKDGGLHNRPR